VLSARCGWFSAGFLPGGEVVAGGEGVGVVGAQYPRSVVEQVGVRGRGVDNVARLLPPVNEVVAGGEGVGVVGAEYAEAVGE
jgi:hypothetical protein